MNLLPLLIRTGRGCFSYADKNCTEENQTLIASLHSVEYARKYFTRIIAFKNGEIFFDLPTEKVTDDLLTELYQIKEQV